MKTNIEYEESDIDLVNNRLHGIVSLAIPILSLSYTKDSVGDGKDKEKMDALSRKIVASFLNMVEGSGYTIIKKDTVPEAFRY